MVTGRELYQQKVRITLQARKPFNIPEENNPENDSGNDFEENYVDFDTFQCTFFQKNKEETLEKACQAVSCNAVNRLIKEVDFAQDLTDYVSIVLNTRGNASDKQKIIAALLKHSYPPERLPSQMFLTCIAKKNLKLMQFIADKIQPSEKLYQLLTYAEGQSDLPLEAAIKKGNLSMITFILNTLQKCGESNPAFYEIDISLPQFLNALFSVPSRKKETVFNILNYYSFFGEEFINRTLNYLENTSFPEAMQNVITLWRNLLSGLAAPRVGTDRKC